MNILYLQRLFLGIFYTHLVFGLVINQINAAQSGEEEFMKKKLIGLMLAVTTAVSMTACTGGTDAPATGEGIIRGCV